MSEARLDGANWHFRSDAPVSFGCNGCFLLRTCGGLRVKGPAFDCQRFCCHKPDCQIVCFNSPANYAKRLDEIGSFNLKTISRCEPVDIEAIRGFATNLLRLLSKRTILQRTHRNLAVRIARSGWGSKIL